MSLSWRELGDIRERLFGDGPAKMCGGDYDGGNVWWGNMQGEKPGALVNTHIHSFTVIYSSPGYTLHALLFGS